MKTCFNEICQQGNIRMMVWLVMIESVYTGPQIMQMHAAALPGMLVQITPKSPQRPAYTPITAEVQVRVVLVVVSSYKRTSDLENCSSLSRDCL